LNDEQYDATFCGQCLELRYSGHCAEALMVDKCPGCPTGGIDVSLGIFSTLVGSESEARFRGVVPDVQWRFTDCGKACK
jgi:hypothetical protein